jgi:hypothetical protein
MGPGPAANLAVFLLVCGAAEGARFNVAQVTAGARCGWSERKTRGVVAMAERVGLLIVLRARPEIDGQGRFVRRPVNGYVMAWRRAYGVLRAARADAAADILTRRATKKHQVTPSGKPPPLIPAQQGITPQVAAPKAPPPPPTPPDEPWHGPTEAGRALIASIKARRSARP